MDWCWHVSVQNDWHSSLPNLKHLLDIVYQKLVDICDLFLKEYFQIMAVLKFLIMWQFESVFVCIYILLNHSLSMETLPPCSALKFCLHSWIFEFVFNQELSKLVSLSFLFWLLHVSLCNFVLSQDWNHVIIPLFTYTSIYIFIILITFSFLNQFYCLSIFDRFYSLSSL